ncbi:MAG: HAD-IA family hydrolase [Nitrososphaerota archaeon]|nr:HAD-IA family hydrolase [Nitrososphaerota archaeon]MDG7024524.1 HAD-IA family hydrolase [Nitrososphaerota archaeon]
MAVAAIFDLDGTLVTFRLDIREWRKVIIDAMRERGFDTSGLELSTPTQEILDSAKAQVPPEDSRRYDSLRREAFSILDSLELDGARSASIFPGVDGVLRLLKSRGFRIGLLTNSGRAASSLSLTRWGLEGFFELVLTREDIEAMKPRPEGLTKAVRMLGVRPDQAYYIGDSLYDVAAAKGAGVRSVAVSTGNYPADRLRSEGADYVISALTELPKVLGIQAL